MSVLDRLLALSDELLDAGNVEAAYHSLVAALHVVAVEGGVDDLEAITARAAKQRRYVESVTPPHPLSVEAADQRGTRPLYATLDLHIDSTRARLEAAARRK